ncbi:ABC transporter ATP-binding protein [Streptomyces sp. SL13]|uniref:ABC transporter ATP-binding protein n=1 Tax=Streptantibioticus silvisoli TaxID=2705255 RepID=A0AA90JWT3_9ACTN|nr:ABC transporter ATP-binding protein [Streptantibioticus silvisoli]MDI5969401.1 ABC transporter ATP-binding protein [Streptantibioticus silvisoli]
MKPPVIELHRAALTYPGPPPVAALLPCDLTVRQGEFLTVVGPSGSGKSSFLNLIGLLDVPSQGRYLLDGVDTGQLNDADRSALRGRHIGFVFQAFHVLPHRTARENVETALVYQRVPRRERGERARTALDAVGLGNRTEALPTTLSGGERQRVAIARALVGQPSLVLCDEPTGNLDTATAAQVLDLLEELNAGGVTLIVITHDPAVSERGTRVLRIRDGVLGEPAEPAVLS